MRTPTGNLLQESSLKVFNIEVKVVTEHFFPNNRENDVGLKKIGSMSRSQDKIFHLRTYLKFIQLVLNFVDIFRNVSRQTTFFDLLQRLLIICNEFSHVMRLQQTMFFKGYNIYSLMHEVTDSGENSFKILQG